MTVCCMHTRFVHPVTRLRTFRVVSAFWLLWIMPPWTRVYTHLVKSLLSAFLVIYPQMEQLDQMVILFLGFGLFSTAAERFYIPNSSHKSSSLPTVSVTFVILFGNNYPSGYGTVPHCAFSLCFPKWCWASFHVCVFWVLTLYWIYAFPVFSLIPWVASEVFFVTLVLATPHSLGDLRSPTRDWTWAPCSEGAGS